MRGLLLWFEPEDEPLLRFSNGVPEDEPLLRFSNGVLTSPCEAPCEALLSVNNANVSALNCTFSHQR